MGDPSDFEPMPAQGDGAELFDLPALFYLTNLKLIDEWASLVSRVTDNVERWLRTVVRERLQEVCAERALLVVSVKGPRANFGLMAYPPEATLIAGDPAVSVGLGWERGVFPTENPVFSAVRCLDSATGAAAAEAFRAAGGAELALVRGYEPRGRLWPIWRHVVAPQDWWQNLDAYREQLVADAVDLIDAVLEPLLAVSQLAVASEDLDAAGDADDADDGDDDDGELDDAEVAVDV